VVLGCVSSDVVVLELSTESILDRLTGFSDDSRSLGYLIGVASSGYINGYDSLTTLRVDNDVLPLESCASIIHNWVGSLVPSTLWSSRDTRRGKATPINL
jgi:hypothetical protein